VGPRDLEIVLVVGTRPEIIKMSPLIHALQERHIEFCFILSGQHHDYEMSMQFVEELGLPEPTSSFVLESSRPASQIGEIMGKLERALDNTGSRLLLIQGDTNSMLAAALTGVKLGVKVAHVEAGLRSYDWRMPEEHNRRMVDHVSDILFAPTETSKHNLENEHVYGTILVTGNTVVDAVNHYLPRALKTSSILTRIPFSEFCFATTHRKENVESPAVLRDIIEALIGTDMPIVFPVHPKTELSLRRFGLYERVASSPRVCLLPPIGYLDTLVLLKNCRLILTDSGGLQEEATVPSIRKPVIVLRTSTERPEGVDAGFAKIVGVGKEAILKAAREIWDHAPELPYASPFGDGKAAERITNAIVEELGIPA
jgi:UDP-N-acetylglucosamine 2-epimerase (non-hydrolysing)